MLNVLDDDRYLLSKTGNVNFFFPFGLLNQVTSVLYRCSRDEQLSSKIYINTFFSGMLVLFIIQLRRNFEE